MSNFVNMSNEATLMTVLKVFKENLLDNLCCVKIGYIDSYDYDTRVSRVVIYNKRVVGLNDKGEHILEDYPPLYCKTLFLGGGDSAINWSIQQGDECIVFFSDREIETPWISGQVSDVKYGRMHDYTDAICLTGFTTRPKATPTDGNLNLVSKNGIIKLDGDVVITGELTVQNIAFTTHVHGGVEAGNSSTGVPQ